MGGIVPDWIMEMSIGGAIAVVGGVVAVFAAVVKAWKPTRRFFRLVDDLMGAPARPGYDERPGLMKRVATMEGMQQAMSDQVASVHHQVHPNGGESLRDEVGRNTEGIRAAHDRLDRLDKRLDDHIDGNSGTD